LPAPPPHRSRRAELPHRALQTASLPQHAIRYSVFAIPSSEVCLVSPALHVRARFPLRATTACQPLPHTCTVPQVLFANGPTVSEYYGLIRLPMGLRLPYNFSLRLRLPARGSVVDKDPMHLPTTGTLRASQVPGVSLHTCHALCRPRQALGELTNTLSLCWLLVPLHHRHLHYPR